MRVYDLTANCVYGLALRRLEKYADAEDVAVAAAWIIATAHTHIVTLLRSRGEQEQRHPSDAAHVRGVPARPVL